jgi:hypothetical protein
VAQPLLIESFGSLPAFRLLLERLPAARERVPLTGLAGAAASVLVAALQRARRERLWVVVAADPEAAEQVVADLEALLGEGMPVLFPQREALPYEQGEPHVEIGGLRVEALEAVLAGRSPILVTTPRAVQELAPAVAGLAQLRLELRQGDEVRPAELSEQLLQMGFELFQGYFYSRPEMVSGREMPADQITIFRLMSLIRDDDTSEAALEEAFRSDLGLSYKLLRIVNSAAVGGRGIESIRHAIQLLGRAALARWLGLLMVVSMSNRSGTNEEISETAIARARFCEQLAIATGKRAASGPLFMLGLFSLLDRLMATPMEEILGRLDLAAEIREALLTRSGPYAPALEIVESYEVGEWDQAKSTAELFNLPGEKLVGLYVDALGWARDRMAEAMAR